MKITKVLPLLMLVFSLFVVESYAQDASSRPSPPMEAKGVLQEASITIQYSAPSVKGRKVWGELVPYDKIWRTGANEATTFETSVDLMLQGQKLPAGKYALFTIPGEKEWTWIFNAVWDQWGAYKYDASKDVMRIVVQPQTSSVFHEQMRISVENEKVNLFWENLMVSFP